MGVEGAIALDATSSSAGSAISSISWSHICTGSNLILVIGGGALDYYIGTSTYDGVMGTKVRDDGSASAKSSIWYLLNPTTGSHTVTIQYTASNRWITVGAISLSGINQSGQPDAQNGKSASASSATTSVTTVANNSWVVSYIAIRGYNLTTTDTPRFIIWDTTYTMQGGMSDPNSPITPAGSRIMQWSWTGTYNYGLSVASFSPYVSGEAVAPVPTQSIIIE
jgi:hypothetical protein